MKKKIYIIKIINKETKEVVQEESRKSYSAFCALWSKAVKNINPLIYKLKVVEEINHARNGSS